MTQPINQKQMPAPEPSDQSQSEKKRQAPRRSWLKNLVRVVVYSVLGVCLLIALAFLSLQTRPIQDAVTDVVRKAIISAVEQNTRAVCRIEKLSGNLLSGFTVSRVSLTDRANGDLLMKAERVEISYTLPMLMGKTLWINRLEIDGLSVSVYNSADGQWVLGGLPPLPLSPEPSTSPEPETAGPSPLAGARVLLRNIEIRHSNVRLTVADEEGAATCRFSEIECRARIDIGLGDKSGLSSAIEHLSVCIDNPEVHVTRLSGGVDYDFNESRFDFINTHIKGRKSDFTLNGSLAILETLPGRAILDEIVLDLRADVAAMSLGEFGRAFPIEMPDTDIVSGTLAARGPVSKMDCQVDLKMDQCHVVSQGLVAINDNNDVSLDINGRIHGLDLAALPALDLTYLPGDLNTDAFTLNWRDIGMPGQTGKITLNLTPSILSGHAIDAAEITAGINGADMHLKPIKVKTLYGDVSGSVDLIDLLYGEKDMQIRIDGDIEALNPAALLKDKQYPGNINGNIKTAIRIPMTYETEDITAEAVFRMDPSQVMGVDLQKADMEAAWGKQTVTVKRMDLKTAFGSASVTGDVSIRDHSCRVKAKAELPDLSLVRPWVKNMPKDTRLSGSVTLTAEAAGPWDQPDITMALTGGHLVWDSISGEALAMEGRWQGNFKDFSASAKADMTHMAIGEFLAPALNITTWLTPEAIHADIDLQGSRKEHLTLSGDIRQWMEPAKTIEITQMMLEALDQPPLVNQGPISLTLMPDFVAVESMHLSSGPASLNMKGQAQLKPQGEVSAALALRDLELSRISGFLAGGDKLKGRISSDVHLSGVLGNPVVGMNLSLEEAAFDKYSVSDALISINYSDAKAELAGSVDRNGAKLLDASGSAFATLSLFPFEFTPRPESLDLRLDVDDADISWISELIDHPEYGVTGRLSATANISGDFLTPRIEGWMRLADGTLTLKKQGLTYETLTAALQFDKDSISIDEVIITGDTEGTLRLSGVLIYDRFDLRNFNLQAKGEKFYVPFHGGVQVWVNPELTLSGDWEHPLLEGKIKVVRGRVNIDTFLQNQPSEIKIISTATAENGLLEIPEEELEPLAFIDPLTADVLLDISKDCWLRGKDAQVEINGNVQLKKDPRKPFVLFGSVNAVRGTYRFQGKLFKITQGGLMFVGQEDLNPPVNIEAQTQVGDVSIMIRLTGTFQQLNLAFDSDPPMDQAEIVSYLLFGRGSGALSEQETFKAEEMALSLTGQMAADKFRDIVGDTFAIDYLNISTGSSGLREGSMSMGKYVMPKVFVVFRQGFSDNNSQQFEVSYEINKYFDIQSQIDNEQTSALDLIWKYEF